MEPSILHFVQQAGMLLDMPRTHIRNFGHDTPDTIASHSFHVATIAYCIARGEGHSHQDALTCTAMGLMHDLAEARTGDLDFIAKHYTKADEARAVKDQFSLLPFGAELQEMMEEYEDRSTELSKLAKDADILAQLYVEWVLTWRGNKLAQRWYENDIAKAPTKLHSKTAKDLAAATLTSDPHQWWLSQLDSSNRTAA